MRKLLVLAFLLACAASANAANIYVAQASAGGNTGANCANARASSSLAAGDWVAGNTIHLCGTLTPGAGGTAIAAQGSGSSGNPITVVFEAGSSISAPYCASGANGCVDIHGRSWITVDGNNAGSISNTANGDGLANQQISILLNANSCNNCVIQNLSLLSSYVANNSLTTGVVNQSAGTLTWVSGAHFSTTWASGTAMNVNGNGNCQVGTVSSTVSMTITGAGCSNTLTGVTYQWALGGAATQMNAVVLSGQNVTVSGNTISDCGWCIYDVYQSGDTNHVIANNIVTNWNHAVLFAASAAIACTAPCLLEHDNQINSNVNWETIGCVYHLDGIHTFGVTGSTMNGVYMYNNKYSGVMSGPCSSGFIFMEQGSPSQSNASNVKVWNNLFDASQANGVNPNGWVGLFSGVGGTTEVYNNTLLCPSSTDGGTVGWGIQQQGANTIFEGNLENKCPQGNNLTKGAGTLTMDYNAYGNPCNGTSNCWVNPSGVTFQGSFAAWKTACSCDSHSFTTATDIAMKLNSDGSLQTGSPAIGQELNLASTATGSLATLASDTTLGATRAGIVRPPVAAWDVGAFQFPPIPPAPCARCFAMLLLPELRQ